MKKKMFGGIAIILSYVVMACWLYIVKREADDNGRKRRKFVKYYYVFNKWVSNVNQGVNNEMLLKDRGVQTVAVYGNGEVGCRFVESLKGTSIKVECIIEKRADEIPMGENNGIKIVGRNETSEYSHVDAIIVTPMYYYEKIERELLEKNIEPEIISIEDLLFSEKDMN